MFSTYINCFNVKREGKGMGMATGWTNRMEKEYGKRRKEDKKYEGIKVWKKGVRDERLNILFSL
jgi:hypothetical protein